MRWILAAYFGPEVPNGVTETSSTISAGYTFDFSKKSDAL